MKRIGLLFGVFILFCNFVIGQTASDFEKKFGSQTYYEIRPKILMSAKFDNSGKVCQVAFQPSNYSKKYKTIFSGEEGLDLVQLKEAFEEVVPKEWRSGQIKPPSAGYLFSGSMFWGDWKTENLQIEANGTAASGEDINFCELFGTQKEEIQNKKIIFCSTFGRLEVLTINWVKRECPKN